MEKFQKNLVVLTENYLSWRKRRKEEKKEKQKKKNPIVDWIEAFVWAAFVVLIINQYFLQAYEIPSSSMVNTLLIQDRIFVNKLIFGPELVPGAIKLPGYTTPKRAEVIIFENPSYISRGPVFDIVQRVLYMLTLSFVDIDRDENGQPKAHFLIKRAIAMAGDRVRFNAGEVEFLFQGDSDWLPEKEFLEQSKYEYNIRRLVKPDTYDAMYEASQVVAKRDTGLRLTVEETNTINELQSIQYVDAFSFDKWRSSYYMRYNPNAVTQAQRYWKHELGWYIPTGRIFPLGDNRDNSRDARYFGPVNLDKVLGKAMFKYWPFNRIGSIR